MIPTFLIKGGNSRYYFRIKIPQDLRAIIGQSEIRRSLKTTNKMLATARSLQLAHTWHQQFERLRMKNRKHSGIDHPGTELITLHGVLVGNQVVPKVTLETEEDIANFQKMQEAMPSSPPQEPYRPPTLEDHCRPRKSAYFADRPIKDLIEDYLEEYEGKWTPASKKEYVGLYRQAIELIGNIPVHAVTRQKARELKKTLQATRKNGKPLAASTINKTLGKMSSVWEHGIRENYDIPDKYNPWKGLQITSKKPQSAQQPAYLLADLKLLFSAKLVETKAVNNRPARYWIPILSLLNGLRIGEAAQQTIDTVFEDDGIYCIRVTEEMRSKTINSIRTVPIHSKIIELGFLGFVEWRRQTIEKSKSNDRRLFVDLKPDGARCAGPLSTWWNSRYTPQFDLTPGTSIHSLRHTCITGFRADGSNSETHRAEVVGHIRGKTQSDQRYGKTVLLPLQEVVESLHYPINIPPWSKVTIKRLHVAK